MPKLKKLILSENLIHDDGAKALAEKLRALTDFEELDVKLNLYGPEGNKALGEALEEEIEPGATVDQFEGVENSSEGIVES